MSGAAEVLDRVERLAGRAERDRTGLFVVESVAPFLHACAAGVTIEAIVQSEVLLHSPAVRRVIRDRRRAGVPVVRVPPERFRAMSRAMRASGVAAIARQPRARLDDLGEGTWLGLERLRSEGNLGTILRTAEATGARGLVLLGPEVDPFHPQVIRASMGAVFHLRVVRATLDELAAAARARGARLVATSPRGRRSWAAPVYGQATVLLVGEERRGLSDEALRRCDETVRVPILGRGDSLNVAVCTGVVLYEMLRQRAASERER